MRREAAGGEIDEALGDEDWDADDKVRDDVSYQDRAVASPLDVTVCWDADDKVVS